MRMTDPKDASTQAELRLLEITSSESSVYAMSMQYILGTEYITCTYLGLAAYAYLHIYDIPTGRWI